MAYSGGVDSTLLLKIATDELGDRVLAVTAESETFSKRELMDAKEYAKSLKAKHAIIKTQELKDKKFIENSSKRCFYCKRAIFLKLKNIARLKKYRWVVDAANNDDLKDYRPGRDAAQMLNVRSPFIETGIDKKDIYALSKLYKLPTQNQPSFACLASRFPYGERITRKKLIIIEKMEEFLRSLKIYQVRVRHHNHIARIEVLEKDFPRIMKLKPLIVNKAKNLGYNYVSLDLEGYRTGSMNEVLK